ncbi:MAG: hypothetical protein WC980_05280 [Candidatus Brocadiia bacterium]
MAKISLCLLGTLAVCLLACGCVVVTEDPHYQGTVEIYPEFIPPPFQLAPGMVLMPSMAGVYYARDGYNLFFYTDSWYYYWGGYWFIGSSFNGPWVYVEPARLPVMMTRIPPGHLKTPPGQLRRNEHHPRNRPPDRRQTAPGPRKDNDRDNDRDREKDKGRDKDKDDSPGHKKKDK